MLINAPQIVQTLAQQGIVGDETYDDFEETFEEEEDDEAYWQEINERNRRLRKAREEANAEARRKERERWDKLDTMVDETGKAIKDAKKRAILSDTQQELEEAAKHFDDVAEAWEKSESRTKWIKWGCDRALDFLSTFTPGGANIKRGYTFITKSIEGYGASEGDAATALWDGLKTGAWNLGVGEAMEYLGSFNKVPFMKSYDADWIPRYGDDVLKTVKAAFKPGKIHKLRSVLGWGDFVLKTKMSDAGKTLVRSDMKSALWNTLQAQVQDTTLAWLGISAGPEKLGFKPGSQDFQPDYLGKDQMTTVAGWIDDAASYIKG